MIEFALALAADLVLGEPPVRWHPVVWIGRASAFLERTLPGTGAAGLAAGALLAIGLPTLVGALTWVVLRALEDFGALRIVMAAFLLKSSFSLRMLVAEGQAIGVSLEAGELAAARARLACLCSRDGTTLDAGEVASATVSSLAENAIDSCVAPLLFWALFGIPGALVYRTVNTLDARVGYRGAREAFGMASARLDDAANLIPARTGTLLLLVLGPFVGGSLSRGVRTLLRDRRLTPSPNGGWPMSAVAGLLGVRLEKRGAYRLGAEFPWPDAVAIRAACRLILLVGVAGALASAALARALELGHA